MRTSTLILLSLPHAGCGSLFNQHAQLMDAMRGVMRDTAARLGESGAGQIAAGGQVINPGIRVCGGVEYYAEARYVGASGQVTASMAGRLDRPVPPEVQARIDAVWGDAALDSAAKTEMTYELLRRWLIEELPADRTPRAESADAP